MDTDRFERDIAGALRRLVEEGGRWNELDLRAGDVAVRVLGGRGETIVRVEASSNANLPETARLDATAIHVLHQLGFEDPEEPAGDFWRTAVVEEAPERADLAARIIEVLTDVYRWDARQPLELDLHLSGGPETPLGPSLD